MMTDNEKAATFIGWVPNGHKSNTHADGYCNHCEAPDPDMHDPRNWVRALEALWESGGGYDLGHYIGELNKKPRVLAWRGQETGAGTTAVAALAALWDAEHPEESVGAR